MLNIYNNVVRYMYTERKQMRNMVHQYERGLYHHTGKNGEAQLKFELNNYLFRGLIKLKKCRFMPLKKFYKYRFNFTNICTLVYHSTVKWLTKPNKCSKHEEALQILRVSAPIVDRKIFEGILLHA